MHVARSNQSGGGGSHVNNVTTSSDMMYSIADIATRSLGVNVDVGGDAL